MICFLLETAFGWHDTIRTLVSRSSSFHRWWVFLIQLDYPIEQAHEPCGPWPYPIFLSQESVDAMARWHSFSAPPFVDNAAERLFIRKSNPTLLRMGILVVSHLRRKGRFLSRARKIQASWLQASESQASWSQISPLWLFSCRSVMTPTDHIQLYCTSVCVVLAFKETAH